MIRVKLLDMMERRGVRTQLEMSKKTGLSRNTITKIRRKHAFRHDTLNSLCRALDCQPGDLLEFVPEDEGT